MKRLIITALILLVIVPTSAFARGGRGYIGAFLGANFGEDTTISDYSYTWTTYHDNIEFDPGVYVGGIAGVDFGMLRLEGELSYRNSDVDRIDLEGIGSVHGGDGNVGALAMMFNAFIDLDMGGPVTPYLGGGIGFANLSVDDIPYYDAYDYYDYYDDGDDDTVFAYQLGAGLAFNINRNMVIDVGYRYFGTEEADFEYASMDYQSHAVMLGFRYTY
jgi:opacity protein-like surface antigen